MRLFTLCNSSLTPGRLNPAFNPLGCLKTGLGAALLDAAAGCGFFRLIDSSAFN
jgi:hypothetical protein